MARNGTGQGVKRPPTILDVARYILANQDPSAEPITPKKLQKLVYLAQGTTLAMLHRSLWDTSALGARVTAWREGPVVPELYREFRSYRWNELPVPSDVDAEAIDPAARTMIDAVINSYGRWSADKLAKLTHEHEPWQKAWAKAQANPNDDVISEPDLKAFFSRWLAGPTDPRKLSPEQLTAAMQSRPDWAKEDARAAAEIAAGKGMSLGELRRFLGL
jgi:uncharacterized phage-associated protein